MPMALLKATVGHPDNMDPLGTYGHEVSGEMKQAAQIVDIAFGRIIQELNEKWVGKWVKSQKEKPGNAMFPGFSHGAVDGT